MPCIGRRRICTPPLRDLFKADKLPAFTDGERRSRVREVLGPAWRHLEPVWKNEGEWKKIRNAVHRNHHTIGQRALVLSLAAVLDVRVLGALRQEPTLLKALGRSIASRNDAIHPKPGSSFAPRQFREDVLVSARGLMSLDLSGLISRKDSGK